MAGLKRPQVTLTPDEHQDLLKLIRAHKTPQHCSFRAQIILRLAQGQRVADVAKHLGTSRRTIQLWRHHWRARPAVALPERLQDAPRPGVPPTFSPEQWCQIIAVACEPPEACGRPISHWTPRELADEAIKRGIVATIAERHVGRFLKSGRAQTTSQSLLAESGTRGGR
jgi:putative transposase